MLVNHLNFPGTQSDFSDVFCTVSKSLSGYLRCWSIVKFNRYTFVCYILMCSFKVFKITAFKKKSVSSFGATFHSEIFAQDTFRVKNHPCAVVVSSQFREGQFKTSFGYFTNHGSRNFLARQRICKNPTRGTFSSAENFPTRTTIKRWSPKTSLVALAKLCK